LHSSDKRHQPPVSPEESERRTEALTGFMMLLSGILVVLSAVLITLGKRPMFGSLGSQAVMILSFMVFGGTYFMYRRVVSLSSMIEEETKEKVRLEETAKLVTLIVRMMLLTGILLILTMEIIFVEEPPLLGFVGAELTAVSLLTVFGWVYLTYRRVVST